MLPPTLLLCIFYLLHCLPHSSGILDYFFLDFLRHADISFHLYASLRQGCARPSRFIYCLQYITLPSQIIATLSAILLSRNTRFLSLLLPVGTVPSNTKMTANSSLAGHKYVQCSLQTGLSNLFYGTEFDKMLQTSSLNKKSFWQESGRQTLPIAAGCTRTEDMYKE